MDEEIRTLLKVPKPTRLANRRVDPIVSYSVELDKTFNLLLKNGIVLKSIELDELISRSD